MRGVAIGVLLACSACGGATGGAEPAAGGHRGEAGGEVGHGAHGEGPATVCAPERSPVRYRFPGATGMTVLTQNGACALLPAGADEPPFAWMVTIDAQERDEGAPPFSASDLEDEDQPFLGRGELELLGRRVEWGALGGEAYLVGPAETIVTAIDLVRHRVTAMIAIGRGAPAGTRESLLALLGSMEVEGIERASDGWLHDPTLAVCEADGVPLAVPVPAGARRDPSFASQCMIAPEGEEPGATRWELWIGSIPADGSELASLIGTEPDGVRRWFLAGAPAGSSAAGEGAITWLGAPTRWYAFSTDDPDQGPSIVALARATRGDRHVVARIRVRPEDRALLPTLIDAVARSRAIE